MADQDDAGIHPLTPKGFGFGGVEYTSRRWCRATASRTGRTRKTSSAAWWKRAEGKAWESASTTRTWIGTTRPLLGTRSINTTIRISPRESDPARWQTFIAHEREQVRELMSDYGRIDYLDFDIGWPQAAAQDIAEITMMVRKLQPDVIIRGRGIGAYGDYYTPEREIPGGPRREFGKSSTPAGRRFPIGPMTCTSPPSGLWKASSGSPPKAAILKSASAHAQWRVAAGNRGTLEICG